MDVLPASPARPVVVQWLLDTRSLWPEATKTQQLATVAARALGSLLTDDDRTSVLRYYHVRDAKMALGSLLLKHLVVARCVGIPWTQTQLTRDTHGKPEFRGGRADPPSDGAASLPPRPLAFNVSHQAGLVVLAAVYGGTDVYGADIGGFFEVGVDIVSPGERRTRDHQTIRAEGWPQFVDMHADVFAPGETRYLKHEVLSVAGTAGATGTTAESLVDRKLRCFYTLWCLREAYIKMTGEALLAPWLADLEFRRFQPPQAALPSSSTDTDLRQDDASTVTVHDIQFRGRAVDDVQVCLRALGEDYMVGTAIRTPSCPAVGLGLELGAFEVLAVEDILDFAQDDHGLTN